MKTVAVIFGGKSAEHDISIITAHTPIIETLRVMKDIEVVPIYITKKGVWYSDQKMLDMEYFKNPQYEAGLASLKPLQLDINDGLNLVWPGIFGATKKIDVVFTAMHGTYGEDGSLMGILRMANVPFVGCDIFASAVAMDKVLLKQVVAAEGIPVVPYAWTTKGEFEKDPKAFIEATKKLTYPMFVKPVHLGSSIGIAKVRDEMELENAIEVAFHYDNKVLVENGVENLIEVTLPIMGNDDLTLASVERPLNKTDFFDFNDKYMGSGGKKGGSGVNNAYSEIPAKIDVSLYVEVQEMGKKVYRAIDASGVARVDFLIDGATNEIFVNEVNTLPGSLYAHNWKKSGVSDLELITKLLELAQERHAAAESLTHTFNSAVLQNVGGGKTQ